MISYAVTLSDALTPITLISGVGLHDHAGDTKFFHFAMGKSHRMIKDLFS